jgi:hypothetical protein
MLDLNSSSAYCCSCDVGLDRDSALREKDYITIFDRNWAAPKLPQRATIRRELHGRAVKICGILGRDRLRIERGRLNYHASVIRPNKFQLGEPIEVARMPVRSMASVFLYA